MMYVFCGLCAVVACLFVRCVMSCVLCAACVDAVVRVRVTC